MIPFLGACELGLIRVVSEKPHPNNSPQTPVPEVGRSMGMRVKVQVLRHFSCVVHARTGLFAMVFKNVGDVK